MELSILSFCDLLCNRFSLTQVRGLWRQKHAHQAQHEKAPSKRGSIAPDVERSAHGGHGAEGLKLGGPIPVSLIIHLQVLQSPNEGLVGY